MTDQQKDEEVLPLQGGSYRKVFDDNKNEGRKGETHHIPAWGAYKHKQSDLLNRDEGPSVWMTPADHYKTASWGRSKEAEAYRNQQKNLIDQGRFEDALQMDVDDLRSKFGNTYDLAIQQAQEYYQNDLKDQLFPTNSELQPEPQLPTDDQTANDQQLANAQLADQLEENIPSSKLITDGSEVDDNIQNY
jgi:hypothetical protein